VVGMGPRRTGRREGKVGRGYGSLRNPPERRPETHITNYFPFGSDD